MCSMQAYDFRRASGGAATEHDSSLPHVRVFVELRIYFHGLKRSMRCLEP
jgi:hypothetical protein